MTPHLIRLLLAQAGLSLLPVLIFLFALELIDTYKLLTLRRVLVSVAVGCGVAIVCYALNTAVYKSGVVSPDVWARSGAPLIEEFAKALYLIWLLRRNRVGFMVDTAISGFAVGAGFAVLENLTYIPDLSTAGLLTSAIRGLGTAMMHGGTTAIFGIVSVNLSEIRASRSWLLFLPGLAIAVFIHELYNQPLVAACDGGCGRAGSAAHRDVVHLLAQRKSAGTMVGSEAGQGHRPAADDRQRLVQ